MSVNPTCSRLMYGLAWWLTSEIAVASARSCACEPDLFGSDGRICRIAARHEGRTYLSVDIAVCAPVSMWTVVPYLPCGGWLSIYAFHLSINRVWILTDHERGNPGIRSCCVSNAEAKTMVRSGDTYIYHSKAWLEPPEQTVYRPDRKNTTQVTRDFFLPTKRVETFAMSH